MSLDVPRFLSVSRTNRPFSGRPSGGKSHHRQQLFDQVSGRLRPIKQNSKGPAGKTSRAFFVDFNGMLS